jgi:hypothetical protein
MGHISLQEPCQLFVARLARFGQPISHSVDSDISIHLTYLGWHPSLLSLVIVVFHVFDITMTYNHSKCVIETKEFERTNFGESGM